MSHTNPSPSKTVFPQVKSLFISSNDVQRHLSEIPNRACQYFYEGNRPFAIACYAAVAGAHRLEML
jgi:hypothetical protein